MWAGTKDKLFEAVLRMTEERGEKLMMTLYSDFSSGTSASG
jgi:hypothetical protein